MENNQLGSGLSHINTDVVFHIDGKEILKLTEQGFIYNGKVIEDAGEAHKVFLKVMYEMEITR